MREYEMMLILPAEADEKVLGGVTDRITQVLGTGGRITNVDRWGRRRFAFPIDKTTEGFYAVVDFDTEPAALKELERVLSLADDVIRFKVVVRPERAKGSVKIAPEGTQESESGPVPEAGPAAEAEEPQAAPAEQGPTEPAPDVDVAMESESVTNEAAP